MKKKRISITHEVDAEIYAQFCEIADRLNVRKSRVIDSLFAMWNNINKNKKETYLLESDKVII